MTEPTGHCPYLGLKQNRAIRFASPTPEHRCYVSGEPLEIPVDQAGYCLSQGHVHCPLYMGLSVPTTSDTTLLPVGGTLATPAGGIRGWLGSLSPRDRAIYAIMIGMLLIIIAIYVFVGLQTFIGQRNGSGGVGVVPTATATATNAPTAEPTETITPIPPSPTDLPTHTPSATPTEEPTRASIILPPTAAATTPPTTVPAATASPAQATTGVPASQQPTTSATARPTANATPRPTNTPQPSSAPPTQGQPPLPPTQPPAPTQPPVVAVSTESVTLYFADTTGTLYVPVQRSVRVENNQVATAAVRELIAGPRNGLNRLVASDAGLAGVTIANGTATVNFARSPGDERGITAIVLTLTHFPSIQRVQIQVNGQNVGGPRGRPTLNPLNPQNLANDTGSTEFLPLYFPSVDGAHDIRVIRMVPKTKQVAEATVRALLEGPGAYSGALLRAIPEGTELRGIRLEQGIIIVDFTQPFAEAASRDAAIRSIVESLTTLPTVKGVQFLVEGQPLDDGRIFRRPAINPE